MLQPSLLSASVGKPVKEIMEVVVKKCRSCIELLQSPVGKRLIKSGLILKHSADDVGTFIKRYGDDGLLLIENHGDEAVDIFKKYGDDGINYLKHYSDDYLKIIQKNNPADVNRILKHPKGMVFLKESPEAAGYFAKYGDDILTCLDKNPLCIDAVKRTGLSPKVLSGFKDTSISWLEVNLPKMSKKSLKDANALRAILTKYGEPAAKFIQKNWDILLKVGAASAVIANFDEVLAGGRDVLKKTVEVGGQTITELGKETVKATGDAVVKTTSELSNTWKGSFVILGLAGLILGYRYALKRKKAIA
jgi:hypothetical protein